MDNTPHDILFRDCMALKPFAIAFYKTYLPGHIKRFADFSGLTRVAETTTKNHNSVIIADSVYVLPLKDGLGKITLHTEHQSTAHDDMPLRILEYDTGFMRDFKYKNCIGDLMVPCLCSSVFFTGRGLNHKATAMSDLMDVPLDIARQCIPANFQLIDINTFTINEIDLNNIAGLMTLVMKRVTQKENNAKLALCFKNILSSHGEEYIGIKKLMVDYLFKTHHSDEFFMIWKQVLSETLPNKEQEMAMTIEKMIMQKGMQKGVQQGLQQGVQQGVQQGAEQQQEDTARLMLKDDLSDAFIAKYSGLSIDRIKILRESLSRQAAK